jgi:Arylsulfotransferase (ASST)
VDGLARSADVLAAQSHSVLQFVSRPDLHAMAVQVVHQAQGTAPGYLFIAPFAGPGGRGVMILDDAGELVWWKPVQKKGNNAMNFRAGLWKGRPVLTWWEGKSNAGLGFGDCVIVDQHYHQIARFQAGHRPVDLHEFVITPRGTALVTRSVVEKQDLSRYGGPVRGQVLGSIVEELAIPSGRVLFQWRSLDHIGLDEAHQSIRNGVFPYFHANSVAPMADGSLLVSARNTWALYKVARPSGRVLWRLNGKKSDFHMGHGTHFYFQHDARSHAGDRLITLFDDGGGPPNKEKQSRGLLLAVDEQRRRVTLERAYTHRPPLLAQYTGSVQLLHNHNVLVGWGAMPYLTEYAHDGTVLLDIQYPKYGASYRALRFPWSGQPKTKPTLVAVPNAGNPLLYVSWNGATEVASWQLLTGTSPTALQPTATVPRTGFETQLAPGISSGYAAVIALDASNKPLGQSAAVQLG